MRYKKGDLQIPFAWVFALIVGVFILFLAIYAVTKLIGTENQVSDAKTGKEIGILLNPLETGFETGRTTSLTMPVETRIYNKCASSGTFGRQIIQISQKSFNKWTETNIDVGFSNKYIFSENPAEGKTFYLFSKQFEFPFKIADLIYMTSSKKDYCFFNMPEEIKKELYYLSQENFFAENCSNSANSVKICFSGASCDVNVNYDMKYVEKNGERVYFEGDALMYAAIFADKELYDCQVKRLMQRIEELSLLYKDKATFISRTGCNYNLNEDLITLSNIANSISNSSAQITSSSFTSISIVIEDIINKNEDAQCKLW